MNVIQLKNKRHCCPNPRPLWGKWKTFGECLHRAKIELSCSLYKSKIPQDSGSRWKSCRLQTICCLRWEFMLQCILEWNSPRCLNWPWSPGTRPASVCQVQKLLTWTTMPGFKQQNWNRTFFISLYICLIAWCWRFSQRLYAHCTSTLLNCLLRFF